MSVLSFFIVNLIVIGLSLFLIKVRVWPAIAFIAPNVILQLVYWAITYWEASGTGHRLIDAWSVIPSIILLVFSFVGTVFAFLIWKYLQIRKGNNVK